MRRATLLAFIVVCLALAGIDAYAQSGLIDSLHTIPYLITDGVTVDVQLPALGPQIDANELPSGDDGTPVDGAPVDPLVLTYNRSSEGSEGSFASDAHPSDANLSEEQPADEESFAGEPAEEPTEGPSDEAPAEESAEVPSEEARLEEHSDLDSVDGSVDAGVADESIGEAVLEPDSSVSDSLASDSPALDSPASDVDTDVDTGVDADVDTDVDATLLDEFAAYEDEVIPAMSGSLTRLSSGDGLPEPLHDLCADGWDPFSDNPREVIVPEEACYVRIMSEGRAAVREVRSLDLCPGNSSLRLLNIPTSVIEDSLYLSVWNTSSDVEISDYRLVISPDSAELLVEVSASDHVVGASLEVNYLTDDLYASLSYSGLFDADASALRLSEWLTVTNQCGKRFDNAMFSFRMSYPEYEHKISPAVTLVAEEQRRFLSRQHVLSPARTIITAENAPGQERYEITELIKVEGLQDQDLLIPSSPVTIYSMDSDGFASLVAKGGIDKPREYSWFTVETLDRPDVAVQRAKTDDGITGAGAIRDVSYMINIDNRSSEDAVVTIYEYMGSGDWIVVSATVDARPISHSRDLSRREYATFTVQVPANSSRALFYRARISER